MKRAWNAFGNLNNGVANAGVSCVVGTNALSNSNWNRSSRFSVKSYLYLVHCKAAVEKSGSSGEIPSPYRKVKLTERTTGLVGKRKPRPVTERYYMKRSCKNINLRDPETVYPWVEECINRHHDRYDFLKMMHRIGGLPNNCTIKNTKEWDSAVKAISRYAAKAIAERSLDLPPVEIHLRQDNSSLKWRYIGRESPEQQIFDYIAVRAATDIWNRRFVPQQSSSIPKRGQVYGTAMISKWVTKDYRAAQYAKAHGLKYTRKCKCFVKLDVEQCYRSMRYEVFLKFFRRDCANTDLLWLWEELFKRHRVIIKGTDERYEGFMIGALPSQQAAQYLLSFVYRYATGLHKKRRGKFVKLISHMELFMDDMLLLSGSRRDLKVAVRKIVKYAKEELNITLKPGWHICNIDKTPVDMMGYLVHKDGAVTVRPRVFLRLRRCALRVMRKGMSFRQAKRLSSYKGYVIQKQKKIKLKLCSHKIIKKLNLTKVFRMASRVTRERSRNESSIPAAA